MIKNFLCVVLMLGILCCLTACFAGTENVTDSTEKITQQSTTKAQPTTQPTTQEITTEAPKLSSSFDMILAVGYEDNGDYYEVVANETEDYVGTKVEIGIIKNNEWVLEPTTSMPFIDEDGTIYGKRSTTIYTEDDGIDGYSDIMMYIGNGCFLWQSRGPHIKYGNGQYTYECVIYNVETGLSYNFMQKTSGSMCSNYDTVADFYDCYRKYKISDTYSQVIVDYTKYSDSYSIDILDTSSMTVETIDIPFKSPRIVYPISENIFAIANLDKKITFYDADGNIAFESDFKLSGTAQTIAFKNGKCTFQIVNDAGNYYKITIDKQGNVIDSVKLD